MKFAPIAVAVALLTAGAGMAPLEYGSALAADAAAPQAREGWYRNIVDTDFVRKYAGTARPAGVMLIDSRPAARQYDVGHIPGAVNIPDSKFDELAHLLPQDKNALLIFYCGGLECPLSHKSAFRAEKLGYTNIKVYAEGQPEWAKRGNPVEVAALKAKAPAIEQGREPGVITVASFERIYKEAPDTLQLVDVRDAVEFAKATFKGAVNIPLDDLPKKLDLLAADKPIVFFCGSGSRSGEAYDLLKEKKPALKAYFLNAYLKFQGDGTYSLVEDK